MAICHRPPIYVVDCVMTNGESIPILMLFLAGSAFSWRSRLYHHIPSLGPYLGISDPLGRWYNNCLESSLSEVSTLGHGPVLHLHCLESTLISKSDDSVQLQTKK